MGRFMTSSKSLFQGNLNNGLREGFSKIPRGVLSVVVEHPPLQSTFENLVHVSMMPNSGQVYNFYSVFRENRKTKPRIL